MQKSHRKSLIKKFSDFQGIAWQTHLLKSFEKDVEKNKIEYDTDHDTPKHSKSLHVRMPNKGAK